MSRPIGFFAVLVFLAGVFAVEAPASELSLDTSFGGGGVATILEGSPAETTETSAQAGPPGGTYVLIGGRGELRRLNRDGRPDRTFGAGGGVAVRVPGGHGAFSYLLAVDGHGRAIVGSRREAPGSPLLVVRYTENGKLDRGFGHGGRVATTATCPAQSWRTLMVDRADRILAGSSCEGSRASAIVQRIGRDGSLDLDFGGKHGGYGLIRFSGSSFGPTEFAVGRGGEVFAATTVEPSKGHARASVGNLKWDGVADATFNRSASRAMAVFQEQRLGSTVADLQVTRFGSPRVTGSSRSGDFLLQLRRDGRLDRKFGAGGRVRLGSRNLAIAEATDGRIWTFGFEYRKSLLIARRLTSKGHVDQDFGVKGVSSVRLPRLGGVLDLVSVKRDRPMFLMGNRVEGCREECGPDVRALVRFQIVAN